MNKTKYYYADQLEFPFLKEIDADYYSDRADSLYEEDLYHQNIENLRNNKNNSNLMELNLENPWN